MPGCTPFLRHIEAPILALRINIGRTVCNQSTGEQRPKVQRPKSKGQGAFHFPFSSIFNFSFAIEEESGNGKYQIKNEQWKMENEKWKMAFALSRRPLLESRLHLDGLLVLREGRKRAVPNRRLTVQNDVGVGVGDRRGRVQHESHPDDRKNQRLELLFHFL